MENAQVTGMTPTQLSGFITALSYQPNSQTLNQITLQVSSEDGTSSITFTKHEMSNIDLLKPEFVNRKFIKLENLNEFQEKFQEAANFKHEVALTLDRKKMMIVSLSIFPRRFLLAFESEGGSQPGQHGSPSSGG